MLNDWSHKVRAILKQYCPGNIKKILPSSQSAWNTRFYFGHQKLCMDNNVTYFKNKMSTDVHDIDMSLVKKVISQISKPLTRICNMSDSRLSNFIDRHSILNDNQYGFRKNRSTSLALLELV